jgi:hypothetical protein
LGSSQAKLAEPKSLASSIVMISQVTGTMHRPIQPSMKLRVAPLYAIWAAPAMDFRVAPNFASFSGTVGESPGRPEVSLLLSRLR